MNKAEIAALIAKGYCVTSHHHGLVTRIDRKDWREYMARSQSPWDAEGAGMEWVRYLGANGAADMYRRVYSADTISVGGFVRYFPSSDCGATEFV